MQRNKQAVAITALVALVSLIGCQAGDHASKQPVRHHHNVVSRVDGDRAAEYDSLGDLVRDSTSVVVAQAGAQQQSLVNGVPFETTTMTVQRSVSGVAPPSVFRLYQLGANDGSVSPDMVVAASGVTYLLFLTPYETVPGVAAAPDLFTTVGAAAGMYQASAAGFRKTDPDSPLLPTTVTPTSAQAAFRTRH